MLPGQVVAAVAVEPGQQRVAKSSVRVGGHRHACAAPATSGSSTSIVDALQRGAGDLQPAACVRRAVQRRQRRAVAPASIQPAPRQRKRPSKRVASRCRRRRGDVGEIGLADVVAARTATANAIARRGGGNAGHACGPCGDAAVELQHQPAAKRQRAACVEHRAAHRRRARRRRQAPATRSPRRTAAGRAGRARTAGRSSPTR